MRKEKRKLILPGLLLLDRFSKLLAVKYGLAVVNPGVSFGVPVPTSLIIISITFIIVLLFKQKNTNMIWGGGLMLGGGISNLFDRFFYGGVLDFISLPLVPVFNLADALIVSGVLVLLVDFFRGQKVS